MRISVAGLSVAGGLALAAAPAQAAMAYTGEAAAGMTTATAYGYVNPQGETTVWVFAYGTSTKYGHQSQAGTIKAGSDSVLVAAPLLGLQAGTTYHYLLLAIPYTSSGNPDWARASVGQDRTFTTTRGTLNLASSRLAVKRGAVSIALQCASTLSCSGSVSLDTRGRVGGRVKTVRCASQRFSLAANARSTLAPKLTSSCAGLVRAARGHRLGASAAWRLSTGQTAPGQTVTLQG
jgi:hypothetical protein